MQAPILFPRNIDGIRSNPEGYRGARCTSTVREFEVCAHC